VNLLDNSENTHNKKNKIIYHCDIVVYDSMCNGTRANVFHRKQSIITMQKKLNIKKIALFSKALGEGMKCWVSEGRITFLGTVISSVCHGTKPL
jgi:hypothetical protein